MHVWARDQLTNFMKNAQAYRREAGKNAREAKEPLIYLMREPALCARRSFSEGGSEAKRSRRVLTPLTSLRLFRGVTFYLS